MVLGYFGEEKVYDFIIVGGKYKVNITRKTRAKDIQVELQEIAS
jgi:hypothetical protein